MIEKTIVLQMEQGMHARPASVFVREAGRFRSDVYLTSDGVTVNGKSIMGILMLALGPGTTIQLQVDGEDEEEAMEALIGVLGGNVK